MALRAGLIWVDAQGENVLHVLKTASGVGGIEAALVGHSNGFVAQCWEGLAEVLTGTTSTDQYPTVRITAELTYGDAVGGTVNIYLPSPQASVFVSGTDTIDPTAVADVTAVCIGNLLTNTGNTVTHFIGGILIRTRINAVTTITP